MTEGPVAAIDCGTNTIKLLIGTARPAEAAGRPGLSTAVRESRMIRLGQDLDRTGVIAPEALSRAFVAIDEFAALIEQHGAERIRFCATSASRDAHNAQVFIDRVRERLGIEPEVLTGAQEAALAFDGAVGNLRVDAATPRLVLDVGGGSTELIVGEETMRIAHSMNIGSVRLHERHLHADPPTRAQIEACAADIDTHLDASPLDLAAAASVVVVAGSNLTVVAGTLGLPAYDADAIDQQVLDAAAVRDTARRLVAMSVAERRALGYMHPGRADVIDAGAMILDRVLARVSTETIIASESDILDGIAWSLLDPGV